MGMEFPFKVTIMFWNSVVVMVAPHCECATRHWLVCFKMVSFTLYVFHHNQIKNIKLIYKSRKVTLE